MKPNPNHPTRGVMNMQRMRELQQRLEDLRIHVVTANMFVRKSKEVKEQGSNG